jgi:hypothetical protein
MQVLLPKQCNWIDPSQDPKHNHIDAIIKDTVLRRTQEEQADINPRLALPGLRTNVVYLNFETEEEKDFYDQVEEFYTEQRDLMEAIIRCRQAATHPQIFLDAMAKKKGKKTAP